MNPWEYLWQLVGCFQSIFRILLTVFSLTTRLGYQLDKNDHRFPDMGYTLFQSAEYYSLAPMFSINLASYQDTSFTDPLALTVHQLQLLLIIPLNAEQNIAEKESFPYFSTTFLRTVNGSKTIDPLK